MDDPAGAQTSWSSRSSGGLPSASSHVCFLTSSAPLGPEDSWSPFILELAERMSHRGWRVTILMPHVTGSATRETLSGVSVRRYRYLPSGSAETLGLDGGMLPGLRERKLDVLKVPFLLWGQYRALRALHADDAVHLLHSHWLVPQGVIGGRFSGVRGIPHLATVHGSDLLGLRFPGVRVLLKYAARRSQLISVNSDAMLEELRSRVGGCDARIIPIGARAPEPDAVKGNLALRRSLPEECQTVGYVGRVVAEKGILEFVRLLERLQRNGFRVHGLVVGGGGSESDARDLAASLDVGDAIRFVGPVPPDDVPRYMSVMDVLVVPSHYEAQGRVAIEGMLLALPVVAFDTGGLGEIVSDGESGLTVEPGDMRALVRATEQALGDPALRRRLGLRARRMALERFTLEAAADEFDRAYRELLGLASSGPGTVPGRLATKPP